MKGMAAGKEVSAMARADRDREKKRRRQKRLAKRQHRAQAPAKPVADLLTTLQLKVPPFATWPGISDPSLARPDLVKAELGDFAAHEEPGKTKVRQLEQAARRGLLEPLPELDHWVLEEFFYHGVPGDTWHPIDAFLDQAGDRFPAAAQAQVRLWTAARIGIFEIGPVHDDLLELREWDVAAGTARGPQFRAITLNIGGVNAFAEARGQLLLTYLAPWVPAEDLHCGMGYSRTVGPADVGLLAIHLALAHPEVVLRPLPWRANPGAARAHLLEWRGREWHAWLAARFRFPFHAVVPLPPRGRLAVTQVRGLMPSSAEQARTFGIYLEIPSGTQMVLAGASDVVPIDAASPNRLALAEYQAYRKLVGPPPGVRGQGDFLTLR
jgi:hypothetical protein